VSLTDLVLNVTAQGIKLSCRRYNSHTSDISHLRIYGHDKAAVCRYYEGNPGNSALSIVQPLHSKIKICCTTGSTKKIKPRVLTSVRAPDCSVLVDLIGQHSSLIAVFLAFSFLFYHSFLCACLFQGAPPRRQFTQSQTVVLEHPPRVTHLRCIQRSEQSSLHLV
jgi:hypothetical protein